MKIQTFRCNICGIIRRREDLEELTEELHVCRTCANRPLPLEVFQ